MMVSLEWRDMAAIVTTAAVVGGIVIVKMLMLSLLLLLYSCCCCYYCCYCSHFCSYHFQPKPRPVVTCSRSRVLGSPGNFR